MAIQFLVLDLSLVTGVDMSSAEAFVRIHQLLAVKRIMHAGLLWLHRGLADWESVADHEVLGVHGLRTSDPNLFASVRASLQQALTPIANPV